MIAPIQLILFKKRLNRISHFMNNPIEVQKAVFDNLICNGKNTIWGRKYGYEYINTFDDFNRNVPISSYEELKPYFESILAGEQNVLWNSKIKYFSKSSGTTSDRSKLIPVSDEALQDNHYSTGKDMLCMYVNNRPNTKVLTGKSLAMGGSYALQNNMVVGDVSAIIMKHLPFWAEFLRSPDINTALMKEWEQKILVMAQKTANHDIVSMAGVPSWTLVLINKILNDRNCQYLTEVWKNMEVYFHGGVNFAPYREKFKQLIPSENMTYVETYNASEGFFAVQDKIEDSNGMLLMLDSGIYYEFIPIDELNSVNQKIVPLEGVQLNINYALVDITSA